MRHSRRIVGLAGLLSVGVAVIAMLSAVFRSPLGLGHERGDLSSVVRDTMTTIASAAGQATTLPPRPSALLGGLLLADVNGDGRDDLFGVFESKEYRRPHWLGAVSGTDGLVIWAQEDETVVGGLDAVRTLRAVAGKALLVVDPAQRMHALDMRTGAVLWSRTLQSPVQKLCVDDDVVQLWTQSGDVVRVLAGTGGEAPPTSLCTPAYTSRSEGPNFDALEATGDHDVPGSLRAKLEVQRVLAPYVGSARVFLGVERSGGAPAVAVLSGTKPLWHVAIAPGGARLFEPARAAVRYDRLVVPYVLPSQSLLRVACFELSSGRRLWDAPLSGESETAGGEVAISQDRRVFVRSPAGRVAVYDLKSGVPVRII